jgi:hypothetical protein
MPSGCKQLFGPLVERMMDIYQRGGAESRGRCKLIMNCLWGGLCALNDTRVDLTKEKEID